MTTENEPPFAVRVDPKPFEEGLLGWGWCRFIMVIYRAQRVPPLKAPFGVGNENK
jgi:hypothetical protein